MTQPGDGSLTTMTWEAWVKPEIINSGLMYKYDTQGTDYRSYAIGFDNSGRVNNYGYQSDGLKTTSKTDNVYAVVGQWVYLTSTWALGSIRDIVPFIDGSEVSDFNEYSNGAVLQNIQVSDELGRYRPEAGPQYANAVIDEVRWSKTVRSNNWIKTSYYTMNDPSSFFSLGPEESAL